MNKKYKIIIVCIILVVATICSICMLRAMKNDIYIRDDKKTLKEQANKKSKKPGNKTIKHTNNKSQSKIINNKQEQTYHAHKWADDGYYDTEFGWASPEDKTHVITDGKCSYVCILCGKNDIYECDIKSVNDLRKHLQTECSSYYGKEDDANKLTDEQVLECFYVCRQTEYQIFVHNGFKCEICGKKISDQEAVDLGISTWDEIRHKIH